MQHKEKDDQIVQLKYTVGFLLDIVNALAYHHMEDEAVPGHIRDKMKTDLDKAKTYYIRTMSIFNPPEDEKT